MRPTDRAGIVGEDVAYTATVHWAVGLHETILGERLHLYRRRRVAFSQTALAVERLTQQLFARRASRQPVNPSAS